MATNKSCTQTSCFVTAAATFLLSAFFTFIPLLVTTSCLCEASNISSPTNNGHTPSTRPSITAILPNMFFPNASGPIEDASCDMEQLEAANDSQLHVILHELISTAFFRSFAVDLDERCPLAQWNTKKKKKKKDDKKNDLKEDESPKDNAASKVPENKEELEEGCAGGLPDLDPDAEPACSVDLGGAGPGFLGSSDAAFMSSSSSSNLALSSANEAGGEEEEFECTGGKDELDEDAEPLCSLATDDSNPFGTSDANSVTSSFESAALHSISRQQWESEAQENTFVWRDMSDPVVENDEEPCEDELAGNLPETFWSDMCSQIKAGDGLSTVNLQLNPERNTGYNGTHIWDAIYEENCLPLDRSEVMCYEERVLYRLLSGLHTSTTISIAKNYYPPSKRKGRDNWESNPQFFIDKFADHPEHLRNLSFSYVVLLRALKKASPFLYNFQIKTGDILDDEMASILLRRLLDTAILRSCHDVFTAFDESLMFKEQETALSLQENFKGVFHNVSSILDCVQCQQCKLHGKMAMLGYGAALKILFTREDTIALSRNEIVAFLNTIAKMSESVQEVKSLTQLYWSTHTRLEKSEDDVPNNSGGGGTAVPYTAGLDGVDILDAAVGAVASLANQGLIDESTEAKLVQQAFQRNPELMVLTKHYSNDLRKFLSFLPHVDSQITGALGNEEPDAIGKKEYILK